MTDSFRTPLGRVRGLGSARTGGQHWLAYRLISVAYVPLVIWAVIAAIGLSGQGHGAVVGFLQNPVNAVLMLLTVGVTFHHAAFGMQEVFEDYIKGKAAKTFAITLVKAVALVLAVAASFAILKIALSA